MGGKYEGTWQMGKQHGYGVIIDEKGMRKKGFWEIGPNFELKMNSCCNV